MQHKVKCPRCKKQWMLKSPYLIADPPRYKYCPKCNNIAIKMGGYDGRGVQRGKGRVTIPTGPRHSDS